MNMVASFAADTEFNLDVHTTRAAILHIFNPSDPGQGKYMYMFVYTYIYMFV
jgi:hypothetical protein